MNSRKTNVFLLVLINGLERFSYYGMRAMLVLYAMSVLELPRQDALEYYTIFTSLVLGSTFLGGLISDFVLNQKTGFFIGALVLILGYGLLLTEQLQFFKIGGILVVIGVGLTRCNIIVLLGRLFKKNENERDYGFLMSHLAINISAFISILTIGLVSENYGYKYGFLMAMLSMVIATLLFYFNKDKLDLIEDNIYSRNQIEENSNEEILDVDFFNAPTSSSPKSPFILIAIIAVISILYWTIAQIGTEFYYAELMNFENLTIFGIAIPLEYLRDWYQTYILIFVFFLFLLLWKLFRSISIWILFGGVLIFAGLGMILFFYINTISAAGFLPYSFVIFFIFSIGEIIISPIALSFITRLSDTRYSSSMVGLFLVLGLFSKMLISLYEDIGYSSEGFMIGVGMIIGLGIIIIAARKYFLKLSDGLE